MSPSVARMNVSQRFKESYDRLAVMGAPMGLKPEDMALALVLRLFLKRDLEPLAAFVPLTSADERLVPLELESLERHSSDSDVNQRALAGLSNVLLAAASLLESTMEGVLMAAISYQASLMDESLLEARG